MLRRNGLSFRKIAKELDSTVGKVQYQWTKYMKTQKKKIENKKEDELEVKDKKPSIPEKIKQLRNSIPVIEWDEIVALLISPTKVFVYWRLSFNKQHLVTFFYNRTFNNMKKVLRIYDITSIIFNGQNAHQVQEILLPEESNNWILKGMKPNRCYCIEFGVKASEHEFLPLLRSNSIHIPRNSVYQSGELKKEIVQFLESRNAAPNWIEHVSTYSYYEKDKGWRA